MTVTCMEAAVEEERSSMGRAILVSAGPGDVEHMTLQAVRALQSADVILYEPDVAQAVLGLGRREARRVPSASVDQGALIGRVLATGQTLAWVGCGDAETCARWRNRQALVERAGLKIEIVPGLRCKTSVTSSTCT